MFVVSSYITSDTLSQNWELHLQDVLHSQTGGGARITQNDNFYAMQKRKGALKKKKKVFRISDYFC